MKKIHNAELINIRVYSFDIEMILKALELYNFTLNNCWIRNVDKEAMKNRSDSLFYLYHSLLEVYTRDYDIDYRIKCSKEINFDIA